MSSAGAPQGRLGHQAVWTGSEMIVWGAYWALVVRTGGRYDPATDTWAPMSSEGAPSIRGTGTALWAGQHMILWGPVDCSASVCGSSLTNGGARYDPVADSWSPIAIAGAPSGRDGHTAVWTGRHLVIWGGHGDYWEVTSTGGLYDPASDAWAPTSNIGAPDGRFGHAAVWTGSSMIVWGGGDPELRSGESLGGGQYFVDQDPDDDLDGVTRCGGDCDDSDGASHPGAVESCNGIDDDCDGTPGGAETDADQDGFLACRDDCDDSSAGIHPGMADLPGNALDEDCDGTLACDPHAAWKNRGHLESCIARECARLTGGGHACRERCRSLVGQAARPGAGMP